MIRARMLSVVAGLVALASLHLPAAAQCQPSEYCNTGRFAGPWEWNFLICSSYACTHGSPVEFYHGGVIPLGSHAGKVVLTRVDTDVNCQNTNSMQTWMFDPASPTALVRIQSQYVPGNMNCAGNSWDRRGRWVFAGGAAGAGFNDRAYRFDPRKLGLIQFPPADLQPCTPPYIDAPNAWVQIGSLKKGRYYPTVAQLTREPIWTTPAGCTDGINGANVAFGGPASGAGATGNEVWELLDPDGSSWSCPIDPIDDPAPPPQPLQQYTRHPTSNPANPLLDSYGKGFQLSADARRQFFVAGDTRTDFLGRSPDPYLNPTGYLTGKETWTMMIPYLSIPLPLQQQWELWRSPPLPEEHDYGNAVILFRKDALGNLVHNRLLVIGGSSTSTSPGSGLAPTPVFQPELYDPGDTSNATGSTRLLAASNAASWGPGTQVPRLYHSMAFLLPDGRVFVVGGRIQQDPLNPLSDSRLSGELFYPPYLYEAGNQLAIQPTIDGVALSDTSWQQLSTSSQAVNFAVSVTTQTGPVKKVTAIRVSSATHHFDPDQRYIELDYAGGGSSGQSTLTVTAPTEDVAPQGWYHIFVLEERTGGRLIPSVSRFVQFL
jgi:hypothetical protein